MITIKNVEHINVDEQHYRMQSYGVIDILKSGIGCVTNVSINRSILYVYNFSCLFFHILGKLIFTMICNCFIQERANRNYDNRKCQGPTHRGGAKPFIQHALRAARVKLNKFNIILNVNMLFIINPYFFNYAEW